VGFGAVDLEGRRKEGRKEECRARADLLVLLRLSPSRPSCPRLVLSLSLPHTPLAAILNRETREALAPFEREHLHATFRYVGLGLAITAASAYQLHRTGFSARVSARFIVSGPAFGSYPGGKMEEEDGASVVAPRPSAADRIEPDRLTLLALPDHDYEPLGCHGRRCPSLGRVHVRVLQHCRRECVAPLVNPFPVLALFAYPLLPFSLSTDHFQKLAFFTAFNVAQSIAIAPLLFLSPALLARAGLYTVGVVGSLAFVGATAKQDKFLYMGGESGGPSFFSQRRVDLTSSRSSVPLLQDPFSLESLSLPSPRLRPWSSLEPPCELSPSLRPSVSVRPSLLRFNPSPLAHLSPCADRLPPFGPLLSDGGLAVFSA
jgi:hypothetical protein